MKNTAILILCLTIAAVAFAGSPYSKKRKPGSLRYNAPQKLLKKPKLAYVVNPKPGTPRPQPKPATTPAPLPTPKVKTPINICP